MAPFRGRGGRGGSRGGRGGRGGSRGGSRGGGKLARSGIRTRNGYKRFDSQRVKDLDASDEEDVPQLPEEESGSGEYDLSDDEEVEDVKPTVKAYSVLMQSFHQPAQPGERKAKRRKIEDVAEPVEQDEEDVFADAEEAGSDAESAEGQDSEDDDGTIAEADDDASPDDPFETHFANPDDNELSRRLKAIQSNDWKTEKGTIGKDLNISASAPSCQKSSALRKQNVKDASHLHLKERLQKNIQSRLSFVFPSELEQRAGAYMFDYADVMVGNRTPHNAEALRRMASLHSVNHILKGRDKVIKNNERLNHAENSTSLNLQDQGYVRPKVLVLSETRQMAANYADAIIEAFQPDQQENRKRFNDSFTAPFDERSTMPEDYRELFAGNNDNSFLTALKFTRKTLKFYSAFYNSDIILASPLGLRRIIENEDVKKRDHDFLSSVEVVILDQADAMQMQNWENVEVVFKHLNLQPKEMHGCDISRVRPHYLDGNAKYLRQTIVFSAYITPEMNKLYNASMLNIAGKAKFIPTYAGAITETSGLGIKQTFSRFDSPSPPSDPDARFKYFTSAILPSLLRLPKPADGAPGILVFVPSYFDFLRLRNYFATSDLTANISFGTIHDYSEVSEQRRARSHFINGRHTILLYTQRAHHFFRLKLRGVKRVVFYGLPDSPIFYQELVEGYLGTSIAEGKLDPVESGVRNMFSKWDGLRLERIVGSSRVKGMCGGTGDTFDFV